MSSCFSARYAATRTASMDSSEKSIGTTIFLFSNHFVIAFECRWNRSTSSTEGSFWYVSFAYWILCLRQSLKGKKHDYLTICTNDFLHPFSGADQEVQYELMKFGIAPGLLPVDSAGNYLEQDFLKYLEDRKRKEEQREQDRQQRRNDEGAEVYRTDYATQSDVILGRGKPYQDHPGNLKLAAYIEENRSAYVQADRLEKTCISWKIAAAGLVACYMQCEKPTWNRHGSMIAARRSG